MFLRKSFPLVGWLLLPGFALFSSVFGQLEKVGSWEIQSSSLSSARLRTGGASYIRKIEFVRPKASTTADQLVAINPNLPSLLPGFRNLMTSAEVSSRFGELYERKISLIKRGSLSTTHNYFDCDTVLRLADPKTGRKVLLLQGDMDVVTDGSDPGRDSAIGEYDLARSSDWYLPETSYSWARSSSVARNPFLDYYPNALKELEEVKADLKKRAAKDKGVVWREMLKTVDSQIYRVKSRGLGSGTKSGLSKRRFLVATKDPFVVLPAPWVNGSAAWGPQMGDFCAVVYKNRIYPAILGDAGPRDKVGEASLRLARKLNPAATGRNRAISDVTVTYLFFPRTGVSRGVPDLKMWREKVLSLLGEIGGVSSSSVLHDWTAE